MTRTVTAFASTSSLPSSTTTYATTVSGLILDYRAEPTGRIWSVYNPCPSDAKIGSFTIYCETDIRTGIASADDSNLVVADIVGVVTYSLTDCLQDCSTFNRKAAEWMRTERCRGVTFNPDITQSVNNEGGNCWLKNGTVTRAGMASARGAISALMV